MGNDNSSTNIIVLHGHRAKVMAPGDVDCNIEDVSEFIVDMLDTLMGMAAQKDHSLLVYFLAMARIEARELSACGENSNVPEKP